MKFTYFTLAVPAILAFETKIPSAFGEGNAPESADFISQWTDSQPQGAPPAAAAAAPAPNQKKRSKAQTWYLNLKPEAGKPWSSKFPKAPGAWSGPNSHSFEGYSEAGLRDPSYFKPSQGSMGDDEAQLLDLGSNKQEFVSAEKAVWKQKYNEYQAAVAAGLKPDTYLNQILNQQNNQYQANKPVGNPAPNSMATPRPGGNSGHNNRPKLPSLSQLSTSTRPSNYRPSRPLPPSGHSQPRAQPYPNNHDQIPPYVREQYNELYGNKNHHNQPSHSPYYPQRGNHYNQPQPNNYQPLPQQPANTNNNGENYLMKSLLITALQKIFENQQAARHHQMGGFRPGFARPHMMPPAIAHPPMMAGAPLMAPVIPQAPAAVIGGPISNPEMLGPISNPEMPGPISDPEGLGSILESDPERAPVGNYRVKHYKSFKELQEEKAQAAGSGDDEEHTSYRPYTKDEELAAQDGYQSYTKN